MIQFIVEKDGSITSPSIVRGLDARLDTAALDAIIVMPDWIPAQEHGVNVRCKYSVPVPFKKPKPAPPVAPKPTPEIKKNSIAIPSVPADSLAQDTVLQVIPMPSADSLTTDTLATDTTLVASADSIAIQKKQLHHCLLLKPQKSNRKTELHRSFLPLAVWHKRQGKYARRAQGRKNTRGYTGRRNSKEE